MSGRRKVATEKSIQQLMAQSARRAREARQRQDALDAEKRARLGMEEELMGPPRELTEEEREEMEEARRERKKKKLGLRQSRAYGQWPGQQANGREREGGERE